MRTTVSRLVFTVAACVTYLAIDTAAAQPAPTPPPAAQAPQALPPPPPPPPAAQQPGALQTGTYPPPSAANQQGTYPPGAYQPPPGYAPYPQGYDDDRRPRRPRRSRGMMIAGIALLAAGYVPPAIIGLGLGMQERDKCDCRDALRLLIPVVGPLTLWKPNEDLNVFFNMLMVIDTLIQSTGLVLTIFGIIRYNESGQPDEEYGRLREPRWSFGAMPTPGGAIGSLQLRL